MKTRLTLLPIKLIVLLLAWLFSQFAAAQNQISALEENWHRPHTGLLLEQNNHKTRALKETVDAAWCQSRDRIETRYKEANLNSIPK